MPRIIPIRPRERERCPAAHRERRGFRRSKGSLTVARRSAVCAHPGGSGRTEAVPIPTSSYLHAKTPKCGLRWSHHAYMISTRSQRDFNEARFYREIAWVVRGLLRPWQVV